MAWVFRARHADLGEDEREGIVTGRPPGGLEVGGNEALVR
jgi:hypothetical protein